MSSDPHSLVHIGLTALWVAPLVIGFFYVLGKVFELAEKTHERLNPVQETEEQPPDRASGVPSTNAVQPNVFRTFSRSVVAHSL
jgi:hypothetical protein